MVTFSGALADGGPFGWRAQSDAAGGWAVRMLAAAQAPDAGAAAPGPIGDWVGSTGCANDARAITLSFDTLDASAAQADVELAPSRFRQAAGALRYHAAGTFDAGSGQFDLRPTLVLRSGGENPAPAIGTVAPGGRMIRLQNACGGTATLTRRDSGPTLGSRVSADLARRSDWLSVLVAQPKPGRLVGTMPAGELRQPSCAELLGWAISAPPDLRLRLFDNGGQGILRQYDDQSSSTVFGSPAYHWFTNDPNGSWRQAVQPGVIASRVCSPADQRDPRWNRLMQVASDGQSISALGERQRIDGLVDRLPIDLATSGGSESEMYRDLLPLTVANQREQTFNMLARANSTELTDANRTQLTTEATRLRALLAARASEAARAVLAVEPSTAEGLADAAKLANAFSTSFPDDAQPVQAAAKPVQSAIAADLAAQAIAAIQTAPPTLDGLNEASRIADRLRQEAGAYLPDHGGDLDAALTAPRRSTAMAECEAVRAQITTAAPTLEGLAHAADLRAGLGRQFGTDLPESCTAVDAAVTALQTRATATAVASQTAAVASITAAGDGVAKALARRAELLKQMPQGADAGFDAYSAALDARIAVLGAAAQSDLTARLAALEVTWPSIAASREMANQAAQSFAGTPVRTALLQAGDTRAKAILHTLADQRIAALQTAVPHSLRDVLGAVDDGLQASAPFMGDPAGAPEADRIRQAASSELQRRAADYLPRYRASLDQATASDDMAQRLALLWAGLETLQGQTGPALRPYLDVTRAAALRMAAQACQQTLLRLGLTADDAKRPMILGDQIASLGTLVCDLVPNGLRAVRIGAAQGPSGDRDLKLFFAGNGQDWAALRPPQPWQGPRNADELFDLAPHPAPPTPDPAILDVAVLVLRDIDIAPDRQALAVVQIGDQSELQPITIAEWRRRSAAYPVSGTADGVDDQTCATFAADRSKLPPLVRARALLACKGS